MGYKEFLILIRWKNVVMIFLILFLFKYVLFEKFDLMVTLDDTHFFLLTLSTVCLAIAGYIINDIYDVPADKINKPNKWIIGKTLDRRSAHYLFMGFNCVGLALGMYLSHHIGHNSYFLIYVVTSLLLYQYAKYLKRSFLLGNLLVSFVIFLSILLVVVFDIMPATNDFNYEQQVLLFRIIGLYALFGFALTFIRELVKDLQDMEGDKVIKAKSLPLVLGASRTRKISFALAFVTAAVILFFSYSLFLYKGNIAIYLVLFVALPLLYFGVKIAVSRSKNQYRRLSGFLKLIMLAGILTLLFL